MLINFGEQRPPKLKLLHLRNFVLARLFILVVALNAVSQDSLKRFDSYLYGRHSW